MTVPRGAPAVLALLLLGAGLTAGWFAAGHPSAPDSGLQQLDLISLAERVTAWTPSTAARRWSC